MSCRAANFCKFLPAVLPSLTRRVMRKSLCLVFLLFCFMDKAQTGVGQVRTNMQEQEQAWNRGDLPAFMEHYWKSDSLKFIGKRGVTYGWKTVLGNYQKSYTGKQAMGKLTFTIVDIDVIGKDALFVVGKWEIDREEPLGGHFSLLWRNINKQWVIVCDHTS